MVCAEAGEFSTTARIGYYKAVGPIDKGDVCAVVPLAESTVAVCGPVDPSANYPCAVATHSVNTGEMCACVEWGEVGVLAEGNCYFGELVAANAGKVSPAAANPEGLPTGVIGRVTEGAADGGICTVFIGQVV